MNSIKRLMLVLVFFTNISSVANAQTKIIGLHKKSVPSEPVGYVQPISESPSQELHALRGRITGFRPMPQGVDPNRPAANDVKPAPDASTPQPSYELVSQSNFLIGGIDSDPRVGPQERLRGRIIGLRVKSNTSIPAEPSNASRNTSDPIGLQSDFPTPGFVTLQEQVDANNSFPLVRPTADDFLKKSESSSSDDDLPTTDRKGDQTAALSKDWMISGSRSRYLPLLEAIHKSFVSKRVIHSLGADVSVESITLLDPEITALQIPLAQSRFDPLLTSQMASNHIDRPPSSFFNGGIPIANRREEIEFNSRLSKEWATGATTSVGYEPSLAYLFFPAGSSGLNPINSSDLVMQAVQPLLRGSGRRANVATIHIAEHRLDQSRFDVESKLQQQLRSIEQAYWQLHASHVRRNAIADAIALSSNIVDVERNRFDAGRVIYTDVARARFKLENLFQQKLAAEREIQRLSLQISQLTGMEIDSTTMLEPSDSPERRKPQFDLAAVTEIALQRNPGLLRQRYEIAVRQNQIQVARNQLRPQLDFRSIVRSSGLENDLGSSLRGMSQFEFVDVTVGLVYSRQVGNRAAKSKYRQAELEAIRVREILEAFERQVGFNIAESLNSLQFAYATFESALRQLTESQEWVKIAKLRYESPPHESGQETLLVALLDYQSAIQSQVDALGNAALALADYNTRLASVEEQRGTLLDRWGIAIANNTAVEPMQDAVPQESTAERPTLMLN